MSVEEQRKLVPREKTEVQREEREQTYSKGEQESKRSCLDSPVAFQLPDSWS